MPGILTNSGLFYLQCHSLAQCHDNLLSMVEGFARLVLEDEFSAVYEYSGYSDYPFLENGELVHKFDYSKMLSYDGIFTIKKDGLEEPEIHTKLKRKANGRKILIEKRVPHLVWSLNKLEKGQAIIDKDCANAFKNVEDEWSYPYDKIAFYLMEHVYSEYQELGHVPEKTAFLKPEGW